MPDVAPTSTTDRSPEQIALATAVHLCTAVPADHAGIAAVSVGQVAVTPGAGNGDWTIQDAGDQRRLVLAAQSGIALTVPGGTDDVVCLVATDGTLRYVKMLGTPTAATDGGVAAIPSSTWLQLGMPVVASGEPNNEPAGMTSFIDEDFSGTFPASGAPAANGWRYEDKSENFTKASGLTGLTGYTTAAQANYSAGFPGTGVSPGIIYPSGSGSETNSKYVRFAFRTSDPWENGPADVNKLLFLDLRDASNPTWDNVNLAIIFQPGSTKDWEFFVVTQDASDVSGRMTMNVGTVADHEFNSGEWVWVECYVDGPDDLIKVWINGALALDEDGTGAGDYSYTLEGNQTQSQGWYIDPTWGGQDAGNTKDQTDYIQFTGWYVSEGDGTEFV